MFPLGGVLFPSVVLPLHVFEPRYRALVAHCLAGTPERDGALDFGVALIERGSEVGGGDVRSSVGTTATIVEATELADGRWVLGIVGTARLRVLEWLDDDPFPVARVEDWPDPPTGDVEPILADTLRRLRRVLALRAEAGEAGPPATVEVSDDPTLASYQLSALAPLGPLDQQRLLGADSVARRLADLARLLDEEAGALEQRLAMG